MALLQWRRFNFFDKEVVKKPDGSDALEQNLQDVVINASSYGRGQIVLGDSEGTVYLINKRFEFLVFKAYNIRVTHLYQLKQHSILVSIGDDEEGIVPIIKVWSLDKTDRTDTPTCSRIVRAIPGNKQSKVTCVTVAESLNYMAVGFENGCVVLFRGDVMRERHSKQSVVYEGSHKVTGLSFRLQQNRKHSLFICTEGEVVCVNLQSKDSKSAPAVLDFHGASVNCSVLSDATQDYQFIIGKKDAVYFYQTDGRGPCLAFDGEKLQLYWFRGYLVLVGRENNTMPKAGIYEMNTVTVYDIQNKLISFTAPMPQVLSVFCEWGGIYVLCADKKMYHLIERDMQTKLELLFRKNLYPLAIELAQNQQYDQDGIASIFRQYGDHLYQKLDYDGAINQYIKTIGKTEPSYVIRKFLDAQRIHCLTAYLQALHKTQLATEDHTTLLLNCYTKLKDTKNLDEFIMTKDREIDFDIETAIKVCRSAGYYEHSVFLAERHGQHDAYLKTQIENIKDYNSALKYIAKLDFDQAESNMKKYGKILMREVPVPATELLKKLCTDYKPTNADGSSSKISSTYNVQKANAEEFILIFVDNSQGLIEFLEHMILVQPKSAPVMYNTLIELYLKDHAQEKEISAKVDKQRKTLDLLQNVEARYDVDQALVLCQLYNLKAGILFLYEKTKQYQQILHYHMDHNEYAHVTEVCKRFGVQDPNLWTQALAYFAKEQNCKQHLVEVLSHIDENNLLPPLLIIQTLAHNSTATLAVVKDYIIRRLESEHDRIDEDKRLIHQYKDDTQRMLTEINQLQTGAKVFQNQKCSICSKEIYLPTVHFLCQHSYHQHCHESFNYGNNECFECLKEKSKLMEILMTQRQSRDMHDQFHNQLQHGADGFSVVAEYYGKGVFNKPKAAADQAAGAARGDNQSKTMHEAAAPIRQQQQSRNLTMQR